MNHSWLLATAYASVCALWWGLSRVLPLWPHVPRPQITNPWRELGIALLAGIGVVLLGQLWVRGIRLRGDGHWGVVAESINQIVIFAPIVAVPIVRRHGWESAWIRGDHVLSRLAVGLGLALLSLFLYSTLEHGAPAWGETVRRVFTPGRTHLAVQVLLEDIAIAVLFVRLASALGTKVAVLSVAGLFAAAHVPSMIATGEVAGEFPGLVRDFGLGILVIGTMSRSADILWIWPVHFSLDITQFLNRAT